MSLKKTGLRKNGLRNLSTGTIKAGDLTHIETQVASGDATIDFTNVFTSDYDRYVIFVDNFRAPNRVDLRLRVSSDGGSTWDNGSSDYASAVFGVAEGGTTFSDGSGGTTEIELSRYAVTTNTLDTSGFQIAVSDPTDSNRATVLRSSDVTRDDGGQQPFFTGIGGGERLTQSAVDSVQFFASGGENIESGIFSVYGVDS